MPIQGLQRKKSTSTVPELKPIAPPAPKRRSWYWWKIGTSLFVVIVGFIGVVGYRIISAVNTTTNENQKVSVFTQIGHLVGNRDALLKGEANDRINILLTGIGGAGHDGPLLTDTIILASVKPSTGQVSLLSIPRDLLVEIPQYGLRKINNATAFGKTIDYPGGGEQLTVDTVARVTGQPIQYFGRIDFVGFQKIIDDLGGININVQNAFSDNEYPTNDYGYQTISFKKGQQKMNGDLALKFTRSRHGTNGEGSDFARSKRQQLVLESVREKAFALGTIINPVKIGSVLSSLGSHTRTNMEIWELLRLARMVKSATGDQIANRVIDSGSEGPLKNTTGLDGAFLLEPKAGFQNFTAIQAIAANVFHQSTIQQEAARTVIVDATGKTGTGKQIADILTTIGYPEPLVAPSRPVTLSAATSIFDQSNGLKPITLRTLRTYFKIAAEQAPLTPLDMELFLNENSSPATANDNRNLALVPKTADADLVIILGKDVLNQQLAKIKFTST